MLTIQELIKESPKPIDPSSIRKAILRGDLRAIKKGKTWLISRRDFVKWIENPQMHKTGKKGTNQP